MNVLKADCQSLNFSVKMTLQGKDFTIFISTHSIKCFNCGKCGHIKQACSLTIGPDSVIEDEVEPPNVQQVTLVPENH